jgi:hypothetical protein
MEMNYCRYCTHHVKLHKEPDELGVSCRWSMLKLHEPHDPETDEPIPQLISETTEFTCNCEGFVAEVVVRKCYRSTQENLFSITGLWMEKKNTTSIC